VSLNTQISGVLGEISPMKTGKGASYFDGKISYEKKKIRLYGFDSSVRKQLLEEDGKAVVLGNCDVKKARHGSDYEVITYLSRAIMQINFSLLNVSWQKNHNRAVF